MKPLLLIYHLIGYVLAPFVAIFLWFKGRKNQAYRQRWSERFGIYQSHQRVDIWCHAVSVGEVVAASSLIEACLRKNYRVLVTTMTPTGSEQVQRMWGDKVSHQYCPFDFHFALKRFLNDRKPKVLIIFETELWPGMIWNCVQRQIPIILANARISNRSYPRYLKMKWFWRLLLKGFNKIYVQSEQDKKRFLSIGASEHQLELAGNLKFQKATPDPLQCQFWQDFKAHYSQRLIWVVGSTHPGEEELILKVFLDLRDLYPSLMLLIVPRHPERFEAVYQLFKQKHQAVQALSNWCATDKLDILLVDRMGWLGSLYSIADMAFVGGSLVPIGGHNLLEPLFYGVPVWTGPFTQNQHDMVRILKQENLLEVVADSHALLESMKQYLLSSKNHQGYKQNCLDVLKQYQGSLDRHMEGIEEFI